MFANFNVRQQKLLTENVIIQISFLFTRRDCSTAVKLVTVYIDPLWNLVPFRFMAFTLPFPQLPILRHTHLQRESLSHQTKKLIIASTKFNRNSFRRVKDGCRKNTSFDIQQQACSNSTQSNEHSHHCEVYLVFAPLRTVQPHTTTRTLTRCSIDSISPQSMQPTNLHLYKNKLQFLITTPQLNTKLFTVTQYPL